MSNDICMYCVCADKTVYTRPMSLTGARKLIKQNILLYDVSAENRRLKNCHRLSIKSPYVAIILEQQHQTRESCIQ